MKKINIMIGLMTCLLSQSCSSEEYIRKDVDILSNKLVLEWNEITYHAFGGQNYMNSLMASRINAMTHVAMHDALNAVIQVYTTYAFHGIDIHAHPIAAAVSAAYTVLVNEIPEKAHF